jgi:hypothetical protein
LNSKKKCFDVFNLNNYNEWFEMLLRYVAGREDKTK